MHRHAHVSIDVAGHRREHARSGALPERAGVVLLALVVAAFLSACGLHRSHHPRPLTAESDVDPRAVRTVGAVDVAFALRYVGAHDGAPMLTIWLRNAGVEPVALDFGRLRVIGYAGASKRALQLQDPRGEIERVHIDAGARGREKVRLTDVRGKGDLDRVCLDVSLVFVEQAGVVPPTCFVPGPNTAWEAT